LRTLSYLSQEDKIAEEQLTPEGMDNYNKASTYLINKALTTGDSLMLRATKTIMDKVAAQLAKSQEVCPEKGKIASDILKVWYPNDEYKELNGSDLILLNMKCFRVAEYIISLCQGTGKRLDRPELEEKCKDIIEKLLTAYDVMLACQIPEKYVESQELIKQKGADQIIALFDEEEK